MNLSPILTDLSRPDPILVKTHFLFLLLYFLACHVLTTVLYMYLQNMLIHKILIKYHEALIAACLYEYQSWPIHNRLKYLNNH